MSPVIGKMCTKCGRIAKPAEFYAGHAECKECTKAHLSAEARAAARQERLLLAETVSRAARGESAPARVHEGPVGEQPTLFEEV